ncbi:hypothetical protein AS157_05735 [Thermosipho sp. 1244]|nr:hypothetical protein [Thermosipho sp. 1244]
MGILNKMSIFDDKNRILKSGIIKKRVIFDNIILNSCINKYFFGRKIVFYCDIIGLHILYDLEELR